MEYVVYILQSLSDGSYYIGYTNSLIHRFRQHQQGESIHTAKHLPLIVVYTEFFNNKTDALKREKAIKKMKSRKYIEWLIFESTAVLASR